MQNFQEQLENTLKSHQKGIQDVINQEMTLYFYAHFLVEHPEREAQVKLIFERVYKDTCKNLEELFVELFQNMEKELSQEALQQFRAVIQEFVHLQLAQSNEKLWDRVSLLEKK